MQVSRSRSEYRQLARKNWWFWRLVLSDTGITYADASRMSDEEIEEANAALDLLQEQMSKNMPRRRR